MSNQKTPPMSMQPASSANKREGRIVMIWRITFQLEWDAQSVKAHTVEYKINNRSFYDILDQICKDSDLYPYFKQHNSSGVGRGAYYAIHSRWLGPNHVNATASEAQMALLTSMYIGEKKAWNWENYVAQHVKYHIILGNLMEYGTKV